MCASNEGADAEALNGSVGPLRACFIAAWGITRGSAVSAVGPRLVFRPAEGRVLAKVTP